MRWWSSLAIQATDSMLRSSISGSFWVRRRRAMTSFFRRVKSPDDVLLLCSTHPFTRPMASFRPTSGIPQFCAHSANGVFDFERLQRSHTATRFPRRLFEPGPACGTMWSSWHVW